MAHGNLLPFLNLRSLSKTLCLCQHHSVLYYWLSKVRRNELVLLRKNTNPTSHYSITPALPISNLKNCHTRLYIQFKLFSLLTLHRKHTHVQPFPTSQAHKSSSLFPLACTHLGAESPSGTYKTKERKKNRHKHT